MVSAASEAALGVDSGPQRAAQAGVVGAAAAVVQEHEADSGPSSVIAALPGVLSDVPVAVLVIDQAAGTVTYANGAAIEMAGTVQLPIGVDEWGSAAGLTDLNAAPLASSSSPLSLVAQGQPVAGEAVRMAVRPAVPSDGSPAGEDLDEQLLWVTGFPLSQAGGGPALSLVVFLQVDTGPSIDPRARMQALRERAVIATDITFTITDPNQDDEPLVWVNPSFTRMSGYTYEESVGRNCRFLQGPATDRGTVAAIRAALEAQEPITTTLINYRKDGTAFWNQVSISPVFDGQGDLVSFVGVQTDVTERVRVEHEREQAFAAEQVARREAEVARAVAEQSQADAERAQSRLALMAEASRTLTATLDMDELLERLAGLCVPLLADWVFLTLTDPSGTVEATAHLHREGMTEDLELFARVHAMHLTDSSPSRQSLRTSRPVVIERLTPERLVDAVPHPDARAAFERLGGTSVMTVPMIARRRTLGAIALVNTAPGAAFTADDVELAEDLAGRAGLAMDNVRLYQQEHAVAETLQRSLLPQLPVIPRVSSAAHYVAASTTAEVGGDFYDLLHLPDGSVGLSVGDVVGHDVAAAASMGHLRGLLRACVWDPQDPTPGVVLDRVDRLFQGLRIAALATMVYGRAVPPAAEGRPWLLDLATAGHPPVLLRAVDGSVRLLDELSGLLIGVDERGGRATLRLEVPPGSTLVAYTDGVIEQPGTDIDQGIAALVARLAAAPVDAGPAELCRHVAPPVHDGRDDIAVLVVRFD
ncbi:SpoIIE family protein phosphatase [Modestobacter sp. I12A-02628]|uniref:SpoIIE family protein phosphatase n=1 Tax=Goekera deserti TaxID=2497753 RepID=A0A7K3WIL2_9ACTN|nr:SpoIIE family protein phosphatase [Goekera deserti]NDI50391.1 SpoIIE family protein phosphatase [Goekera deserti]NEL55343.1 SpoIIE family protein phosphatase [Goekera deserti]